MAVKNIEGLLEGIDWNMLWGQKQWLINQGTEEADGLICLLDDLQDMAVETYGHKENKVFPWKEEDNDGN